MPDQDIATLIAELERALAEATPGPWREVFSHVGVLTPAGGPPEGRGMRRIARLSPGHGVYAPDDGRDRIIANAEYIALARNALPRLLAYIRELERERDAPPWHNEMNTHIASLEAEISDALSFAFNLIPDRTEDDARDSLDEMLQVVAARMKTAYAQLAGAERERRSAMLLLATIVQQAGGVLDVRVESFMALLPRWRLERVEDPEQRWVRFRVREEG